MSILGNPVLTAAALSGTFTPAVLFTGGVQGVWYDPSDFSTMFQDSAGTTPVTAVEQPVGLIRDKSGNGYHASQSTAGFCPVLSAKVNLLTYSEQFDNAAWTKNAANISANAIAAPDGTTTADKIIETATTNHHGVYVGFTAAAGQSFSISLKAAERTYAQIYDPGNGRFGLFVVDLTNGTIAQNSSSLVASVASQGSGWYRVTVQPTASANFVGVALLNTSTASSAFGSSYAGDGTSGLYAWGADLRFVNAGVNLRAYQRVGASTDYDTNGFPLYLKFDGVDDSLATGTISPGNVDKVSLFTGLRKSSDAAQGLVAELSASIALNNGAFALTAPNSIAANYNFSNKGTTQVDNTVTTYTAPITSVLTGLGDISAPSNIIRVNGTQAGAVTTTQGTGNYGAAVLYIGRRGGSTLPFSGNLYGLIVRFSSANLDATAISKTESWINGKTGAY